jgi:hypothetical protein
MHRIIKLTILVFAVLVTGCDTSSNVDPVFKKTYIKYFGQDGDQSAADLLVNEDGSMLLLGNSVSLSGEHRSFLIKVTPEGNVLWEQMIGELNETAVDIELIKTGPYAGNVAIALNAEKSALSTRIKILRMTQGGEFIDSVELPLHPNGGQIQMARTITALKNADEYIVTGKADGVLIKETSPVTPEEDAWDILAFKLDNSLSIIDTVVNKGGERDGCGIRVFEMTGPNAGKLALFSYTDRPFETDDFGFNYSFDILNAGIPVGKLVGDEAKQEVLSAVIEVPEANGPGFLMAGTTRTSLNGPGDLYLVKYDDQLQQKSVDVWLTLDRDMECVAAENAASGYYVLGTERTSGNVKDVMLVKVSRFGALEWTKSFGTRLGDDSAAAIARLNDGRVAIAGTLELQTRKKLALIVLNANGNF